jgi:hypothetical protein
MSTAKIITLQKRFVLQPYTKKDLAELFGISRYVLNKWLSVIEKELGKPAGRLYPAAHVKLLVEKFGMPGHMVSEAA